MARARAMGAEEHLARRARCVRPFVLRDFRAVQAPVVVVLGTRAGGSGGGSGGEDEAWWPPAAALDWWGRDGGEGRRIADALQLWHGGSGAAAGPGAATGEEAAAGWPGPSSRRLVVLARVAGTQAAEEAPAEVAAELASLVRAAAARLRVPGLAGAAVAAAAAGDGGGGRGVASGGRVVEDPSDYATF